MLGSGSAAERPAQRRPSWPTNTPSSHNTGGTSGGIPVGIAVARQRVQPTPPPPLTVVTCEERSTNQIAAGWPLAPPHWQYTGGVDQTLGGVPMGFQLARDPISGQFLLLPPGTSTIGLSSNNSSYPAAATTMALQPRRPVQFDQTQRLAWPGPFPSPSIHLLHQPFLLDRLIAFTTPAPDKRRPVDQAMASVVVPCDFAKNTNMVQSSNPILSQSQSTQGLALIHNIAPAAPQQFLIHQMPQNNSVLLSTQLTAEQSLNTSVVISNQLSENTVLGPQVIGALDGSFQGTPTGLLQHQPSLVISHTETNSFVRSDCVNTMFPLQQPPQEPVVIKREVKPEPPVPEKLCLNDKATSPASDTSLNRDLVPLETSDEDSKEGCTRVQDASNQTETPTASDDDVEKKIPCEDPPDLKSRVDVKEENSPELPLEIDHEMEEEEPMKPDLSGLELLSNSIMEYESVRAHQMSTSPESVRSGDGANGDDEEEDTSILGGLGLLCQLAHERLIEETQKEKIVESSNPEDEGDDTTDGEDDDDDMDDDEDYDDDGDSTGRRDPSWEPGRKIPKLKLASDVSTKKRPGRPKKSMKRSSRKIRTYSSPSKKPPVLEPWSKEKKSSPLGSPPTLTPHKRKRSDSSCHDSDVSVNGRPPLLSPSPLAPKKRKVGRPKKNSESPPAIDSIPKTRPVNDEPKPNKILPKLKAEAKIKDWCDEDEPEMESSPEDNFLLDSSPPLWTPKPKEKKPKKLILEKKVKKVKQSATKPKRPIEKSPTEESKPITNEVEAKPLKPAPECTIAQEHLEDLPRRIIFKLDGFLYSGDLKSLTPPDLYSITLDKERGHRPHIVCREEVLKLSFLEVKCGDFNLTTGMRICAYWSQQYRWLYPGTVCTDSGPEEKFVSVEFDDGDNGKINKEEIRLLPSDYPLTEYDPNPLNSLRRRRRHSSSTCDGQTKTSENSDSSPVPTIMSPHTPELKEEKDDQEEEEEEEDEEEEGPPTLDEPEEPLVHSSSELFLDLQPIDPEELRKIEKKKKKERQKLKLLENPDLDSSELRKCKKHKDKCCKKKHKHKHRHRKHKHEDTNGEEKFGGSSNANPLLGSSTSADEKAPPERVEEEKVKPSAEPEKVSEKERGHCGKKKKEKTDKPVDPKTRALSLLVPRKLWTWSGKGLKRGYGRGRKKTFYKEIQRGKERISVGECAVFVSTGRPDRPYIGRIDSMWECGGSNMYVKVSWFYHPEETIGVPDTLPYPGALFESPHSDENKVQTISHKCDVLPLEEYKKKVEENPRFLDTIYHNKDTFYLAGHYDPTNETLTLASGIDPQ